MNANYYTRVAGYAMAEIDNYICVAQYNRNYFFLIDKETRNVVKTVQFEKEEDAVELLYTSIQVVDKNIIFVPYAAKHVAIYNFKDSKMHYITVDKIVGNFNTPIDERRKFCYSFCSGKDVYLLGATYPIIARINIETLEIQYYSTWIKLVDKYIPQNNITGYFSQGIIKLYNKILIPMEALNGFLECDFEEGHFDLKLMDIPMTNVGGVYFDEKRGNAWIVPTLQRSDSIVKWNVNTDKIKIIHCGTAVLGENGCKAPVFWNGKLYVFTHFGIMAYIIDIEAEENCIAVLEKCNNTLVESLNKANKSGFVTLSICTDEGAMYFVTGMDFEWHRMTLDQQIEHFAICHNLELEGYYEQTLKTRKSCVYEGEVPLNALIKFITNKDI